MSTSIIPEQAQTLAREVIERNTLEDGTLKPSTELKQVFLQYTLAPKINRSIAGFFRTIAPMENRLGKDLCQFDEDDLDELFSSRFSAMRGYNIYAVSAFRHYTEFCESLGVRTSSAIASYTPDLTNKIRESMVASPMHLQLKLDEAFHPVNTNSSECLYRCVLWLAFAGVPLESINSLTADDVDLDRLRVKACDSSFPLYSEAISAFKQAINNTQFATMVRGGHWINTERMPGNLLLRGIKKSSVNATALMGKMNAKAHKKGLSFSYALIRKSGHFYRIYELERIGYTPDFAGVLSDSKGRGESQYRHYIRVSAALLAKDYEAWKKAFG